MTRRKRMHYEGIIAALVGRSRRTIRHPVVLMAYDLAMRSSTQAMEDWNRFRLFKLSVDTDEVITVTW